MALGFKVDKGQSCIQVGEDKRSAINRVEKFRLSFVAQQQRAGAVIISTSCNLPKF